MNSSIYLFARALARSIFDKPFTYEWTVQGFGMLRTYLDAEKRYRLNVWHKSLAVPGVSVIHDHPWDFKSLILAGQFYNTRYVEDVLNSEATHMGQRIRTGEGGGPEGKPFSVALAAVHREVYWDGDVYCQGAEEIHKSEYEDGTVTLNDRTRRPDPDHALVFWPYGEQWVDAEPRPATRDEIIRATSTARIKFDG